MRTAITFIGDAANIEGRKAGNDLMRKFSL
jgi:hypothetical protein